MNSRLKTIKEIANKLHEKNIQYVFLRYNETKIEQYSEDLDILVKSRREKRRLVRVIQLYFAEKGYRLCYNKDSGLSNFISFYKPGSADDSGIDIFSFEIREILLVDRTFIYTPSLLRHREMNSSGIFVLTPEFEAACIIMRNSVTGRAYPDMYSKLIREIPEGKLSSALNSFIKSGQIIREIQDLIVNDDFDKINAFPVAGNSRFRLYHLVLLTRYAAIYAVRYIIRFFHPPGRIIVLYVPDGSGKSTISNAVSEIFNAMHLKTEALHFYDRRYDIIERAAGLLLKNKKDGLKQGYKKASGKSGSMNFVRKIIAVANSFLGYCVFIRPKLVKGKYVIYDRYYADLFSKNVKDGIPVSRAAEKISRVLPRPHFIFMMQGDPEIIIQRKDELSREQIEFYLKYFQYYVDRYCEGIPSFPVDISMSVEEISLEIIHAVFTHYKS